ncbi:hypothetical protein BDV95DRAFT_109138 [Massariosphaeria phaeospora]|uniref:Uncharacterized protein n=1 Tax=Massariosphaeria phaeospora TaxID=100035 RepID=A0A7C8MK13_9PLEO|nr:hypothetical protein BDV95DRAFT_109138 [Massariosphaeria phaeospora]
MKSSALKNNGGHTRMVVLVREGWVFFRCYEPFSLKASAFHRQLLKLHRSSSGRTSAVTVRYTKPSPWHADILEGDLTLLGAYCSRSEPFAIPATPALDRLRVDAIRRFAGSIASPNRSHTHGIYSHHRTCVGDGRLQTPMPCRAITQALSNVDESRLALETLQLLDREQRRSALFGPSRARTEKCLSPVLRDSDI